MNTDQEQRKSNHICVHPCPSVVKENPIQCREKRSTIRQAHDLQAVDGLMICKQSAVFGQIQGYIQSMQRMRVTPPVLIEIRGLRRQKRTESPYPSPGDASSTPDEAAILLVASIPSRCAPTHNTMPLRITRLTKVK
jgi:hypothetical protein